MIQTIKELGDFKSNYENQGNARSPVLSIVVQNPNKDGNCPKVLMAVFEKVSEKDTIKFNYKEIRVEDFSKDKILKYLYRKKAPQGPDFTLSSKITEVDKFFKNKIESWVEKYKSTNNMFINSLCNAVERSKDSIKKDLETKYREVKSQLKKNEGCLFTVGIIQDEDIKYIGDFEDFRVLLIENVKEDYREIAQKGHICSVCWERKDEVYGNSINKVFKFYTLDKPGYIAGGFDKFNAWKNAPVCFECTLKLEEGKKFMDEFLKYKMGGQQYYLIPKFIFGLEEEKKDIVKTFFKCTLNPEKNVPDFESIKRISNDEKEILEVLVGNLKDILTYNFLFFKVKKEKFEITCLIEDVLPSRISTIYKTKREVESFEIFKNVKVGKNKYMNIEFTFDVFRKFVPSINSFLEIVDKTFKKVKFNSDLLFSWFMERIRESYMKQEVLEAFLSFLFFKRLGVLFEENYEQKGGKIMNELKEKIEEFFNKFPDIFYTPSHKTVFLLGVLTQELLKIQFKDRGSTPFRKHLKNLKMKEEDFKRLFPQIQNKLEEYKKNKNYYRDLESLISLYFIESGKNWKINTDELNFYFVLGMNLSDEISNYLKIKEEVENE